MTQGKCYSSEHVFRTDFPSGFTPVVGLNWVRILPTLFAVEMEEELHIQVEVMNILFQ